MDLFSIFLRKSTKNLPNKPKIAKVDLENGIKKPENIATKPIHKPKYSHKKRPSVNLSTGEDTLDFTLHYKNKKLVVYLYISKKGLKETWKAELNEEEMNKLLYNLFLIFSNPQPFQNELRAFQPSPELEEIIHINPNPSIHIPTSEKDAVAESIEKLAFLLNK